MQAGHPENNAEKKSAAENVPSGEEKENHAETFGTEVPSSPETMQMPEEKHRSWFASILHFLFSSETAVGRFMRPALRWTAFALILFAAGLLAMYFWRVRPTERLLTQTAGELGTVQAQLVSMQDEVTTSQASMNDMQTRMQAAEKEARIASQHYRLVALRNDIASARVALIADQDIAAAILNLSAAELDLEELAPAIRKINPTLAGELKDDLASIKKGLNTRPVDQSGLADDLFSFDVKLLGLEKLMFSE
jgi:HAMP domain-containing protein